MKRLTCVAIGLVLLLLPRASLGNDEAGKKGRGSSPFVRVEGTRFVRDGKPFAFLGANYWQGINLGSKGSGGDRERLKRELDHLKSLKVLNLRVMAASEGPDSEPLRMVPALQTAPGKYNEDLLNGLDFLLKEMKDRGMTAVMVMNNFWHWSGGMAQYSAWNGGGPIPYPPPHPGGSWDGYQLYAAAFYTNAKAVKDFRKHIAAIVNRKNVYTGVLYKDDPTIMSWELANEPRGTAHEKEFNAWIGETAKYIKSIDKKHLVTTGCEGDVPYAGLDFRQNHSSPHIDYMTAHLWVQNWGIYDPKNHSGTYGRSEAFARSFIENHIEMAAESKKPVVLEEFGLARDENSFDPGSPVTVRDGYYRVVFDAVYKAAAAGKPVAGANFWAWAGEGRPQKPFGKNWKAGDGFIGDPPHEPQGWYSVYATDKTTLEVIEEYATKMDALR